MGPPRLPPNWLRRKAGGELRSKKLRASNLSFRRNSNADPWKPFVPERLDALTTAPLPPNCVLYVFESNWNSAIPSTPRADPNPPAPGTFRHQPSRSWPSSNHTVLEGRDPAIVYFTPLPAKELPAAGAPATICVTPGSRAISCV